MLGFAKLTKDITVGADAPPSMWELPLLSFEEIARDAVQVKPETTSTPAPGASASAAGSSKPTGTAQRPAGAGFQQAAVNATGPTPAPDAASTSNLPNAASAAPSDQASADL